MSPVASTTSAAAFNQQNTSARVPQKNLGQNDFLKLITVQLANQDPMKPMEDTAFIAQMAQFSALEQSNALVKEFGLLRSSSDISSASSLIGTQVTMKPQSGSPLTGIVTAVDTTGAEPALVINGQSYAYSGLQRVELPVLTTN